MDEKSEEHKEEEVKRSEKLNHIEGIFALGDCCANIGSPLPALAQVDTVSPNSAQHGTRRKAKENDENVPLTGGRQPKKSRTKRSLTVFEKLQRFYAFLKNDLEW